MVDNQIPTICEWLLGQQGAIFLSTCVAVAVAVWQISETRKIARKRATIDLIAERKWDKDYLVNRDAYIALREDEKGLERWAGTSPDVLENQRIINNVLGDYELVAIGINKKILDETFFREWYESTLIHDYQCTLGYLRLLNDPKNTPHGNQGKYFVEMQALAKKWTCNPMKNAANHT